MTNLNKKKLNCPLCGRCVGLDESEDENAESKVLLAKPRKKKNTKLLIHQMVCPKCKADLFVSFESKVETA